MSMTFPLRSEAWNCRMAGIAQSRTLPVVRGGKFIMGSKRLRQRRCHFARAFNHAGCGLPARCNTTILSRFPHAHSEAICASMCCNGQRGYTGRPRSKKTKSTILNYQRYLQ